MTRTLFLAAVVVAAVGCAPKTSNYYAIETPKGTMVVQLYDETPQHRDNFRKLVAEGYYDGTRFHRVIGNFMIQGGDPNSKDDDAMNDGMGGPGYTIPAEFNPSLIHRRGALASARDNNPERASSGSQFYIVQGSVFDDSTLAQMEARMKQEFGAGYTMTEEARNVYRTEGGVPWLDMNYTVFGQLVDGFDVLDTIAGAATPNSEGRPVPPILGDQPNEPIPMTIRALPDYRP